MQGPSCPSWEILNLFNYLKINAKFIFKVSIFPCHAILGQLKSVTSYSLASTKDLWEAVSRKQAHEIDPRLPLTTDLQWAMGLSPLGRLAASGCGWRRWSRQVTGADAYGHFGSIVDINIG